MNTPLKEMATSFLKTVAFGDVQAGYDKYVAPNFIHHNQYFKGDRQSLLDAMAESHKTSPNKVFEPKHVYQEGNTVVVHSHLKTNGMEMATVHILRFDGNKIDPKIIEMWDTGQVLEKNSPNENGAF